MQVHTESKTGKKLALSYLDLEAVRFHWENIEQSLKLVPHTWERWTTIDDIRHELFAGYLQAWSIGTKEKLLLVVLTRIIGDTLVVVWACGDKIIDEAIPLLDAGLESYAIMMGLSRIAVVGRLGWVKMLRSIGYEFDHVQVSRRIKRNMQ